MDEASTEGIENKQETFNEEDELFLVSYINEAVERYSTKEKLRIANQNATNNRPSESELSKLDSNLKRNTTFVKKIKNFTAIHVDVYLKEVKELNLSKYISEIAAAFVDAKLKMNDIEAAVKLCSDLHQVYSDFSQYLFENWQKSLSIKMGDKISNPSKLRVDLRFYSELLQIGLFNNRGAFSLLGNTLTTLINMDKDDCSNSSIILTFCKYCGEDYAGLVPNRIVKLSEFFKKTVPRSTFLSLEKQQNVRSLLNDYFTSLCKHLSKIQNEIQTYEQQNMKILHTKGELSQERKEKLEALQSSYHKLLATAQQFSELLNLEVPIMNKVIFNKCDDLNELSGISEIGQEGDGIGNFKLENIWCDPETLRFYTELPELEKILPQIFIKKTRDSSPVAEEVVKPETPENLDEGSRCSLSPVEEDVEEAMNVNPSNKSLLESFIVNLPNCVNRELIDNAAIDFLVSLNNKYNRKKLIRALFGVSRIRLDLLPFYARFVAILAPVVPEVSNDLCAMLKQDFRYHVFKKDQINFESKIKVVRYIGELVKFELYSRNEVLRCFKILLNDFNHHHIEMASNLLEVCGRFLYCHADSHQRMKIYLEQMMRKKSVLALDSRYVSQIENAYYQVIPPDIKIVIKKRPVLHQFLRKLLYQDLHKNNTDKIVRLMRRLDWNNPEVATYTFKCLSKAYNVKYLNIRYLANLLAGLIPYQEEVGTKVVDNVLEDIRLGMEANLPKYNQKRVAQVKYLGELYNYRVVESADIFKVLYTIISFGVSLDVNFPSSLDPPHHLFRIRLACVLLDTCGTYFSSGSSKRKLDYYLIFLQSYYWYKRKFWKEGFPPSLEHLYTDTLNTLRPRMKYYANFEEAQIEVEKIKTNLGIDNLTNPSSSGKLEPLTEVEAEDQDGENLDGVPLSDSISIDDGVMGSSQGSEDEDMAIGSESKSLNENPSIPSIQREECQEDIEFVSAFEKMMSDNIQERIKETVKPTSADISVPVVSKSLKKNFEQLQEFPDTTNEKIAFVLMLRKGNKQQYKNFEADIDSQLVQNLRDQEQAQKEEKERVKRLTLNITERFEEEDYQEITQQQSRPSFHNVNRERKKYQHPKGAPDADLIFGPKKLR